MQQRFQEESQSVVPQSVVSQVSEPTPGLVLPPAATHVLTRLRQQRRRNARRKVARYAAFFAVIYGAVFAWTMIALFKFHSTNVFAIMVPVLVAAIGVSGWRLNRSEMMRPAFDADALRRIGGPAALGPLLQLLNAPETRKDHESIRAAATLLLPQIGRDNADLLDASSCAFLYSELAAIEQRSTTDPEREDLALAILSWVAQNGEEQAAPIVARLAGMEVRYPAQQRVRDAARECLLRLHGNAGTFASTEGARSLPVSVQESAAGMALRPASLNQDALAVTSEQTNPTIAAAFVRQIQDRTRRHKRKMIVFQCVNLACVIAILVGTFRWGGGFWSPLCVGINALFALALYRRKPAYTAEILVQQGGKQAVGPLLEQLSAGSSVPEVRAVMIALTTLLPQLNASDAHLLNERQRHCLYRLLRGATMFKVTLRYVTDFRVAALKALEQVGDAQAIPVVERLANMSVKTPEQTRIRDAARNCLPLLQANVGNIASDLTLLRASANAEVGMETLLRAAGATSGSDPQQLLRGTAANDDTSPAP